MHVQCAYTALQTAQCGLCVRKLRPPKILEMLKIFDLNFTGFVFELYA